MASKRQYNQHYDLNLNDYSFPSDSPFEATRNPPLGVSEYYSSEEEEAEEILQAMRAHHPDRKGFSPAAPRPSSTTTTGFQYNYLYNHSELT